MKFYRGAICPKIPLPDLEIKNCLKIWSFVGDTEHRGGLNEKAF